MASSNELLDSAIEQLQASLQDPTLANNWAQVRSRRLLESVAPDSPSRIDYRYSTTRLKRVSTAALRTALLLLDSDRPVLGELSDSLRRAAEMMEYVSSLADETNPESTRIVAAGLYQLAGYEANSLCIARDLPLRPLPDLDGSSSLGDILDRWSVLALRRQLLRLRIETVEIARNSEPLERAWIATADEGHSAERLVDLAAVLLAAEMYGALALSALRGPAAERTFREASQKLAELLLQSGRALELLEARTLEGVGELLLRNGVWNQVPAAVMTEPIWRRYATLSARGVAPNMLDATSRIELWESQRRALAGGLLEAPSGFSVQMPTNAGKTRIAELAIINMLASGENRKAIYVAPFRSLADEVEEALTPILADLGFRVSTVMGGFEVDELEAQIVASADLIVTTPEKLALLTRIRPELLADVGLLVLDEGHVIEDDDRGVSYELLLTKLRHRLLPEARVLFVSAVISSDNAADFAEWLCSDRGALIESDWRPARQLVGIYNARDDRITYPLEGPVAGAPAPFVVGAATSREYVDYTPKLHRERSVEFPGRTKGEIVAELAIRFSGQGSVLVFATSRINAESVARTIQRGLQLRRQTPDADLPSPFAEVRDRPARAALDVASRWLGDRASLSSLLQDGIGVHHAGLPDPVRRAIEADFRRGLLPVIVATTTLAQGVNLPVKTAIVHSIARFTEDDEGSGRSEEISSREFQNIVGRAGRATRETEGHVILAAVDDRQARAYRSFLRRELPPVQGQLFRVLQALISQRLSDDRFRQLLDSELVSLMVEESVGTSAEALFRGLLGDSFVSIQARDSGVSLDSLYTKGSDTIATIRDEVSDDDTRGVFAKTGLDVRSCMTLLERISSRADHIASVLFEEETTLDEVIASVLPDIVDLPQMDTGYDFTGDLTELASDWVDQVPMPEITGKHLTQDSDEKKFHRFISDFFGFRMPWGIGAYLAIAEHVLESDREVSETVRWLPTMIRYGVRNPNASWAMTLGCPSRELSGLLAAAFASEADRSGATYTAFVTWFASLTEEDFVYRFGASPHEAEVLTRRSASMVPGNRSIAASLRAGVSVSRTAVSGLHYDNRVAALGGVAHGSAVRLVRDYGNQYDPNAIEVRGSGGLLGYVPRTEARLIAPLMDVGAEMAGTVVAIDRSQSAPRLEIEIARTDSVALDI